MKVVKNLVSLILQRAPVNSASPSKLSGWSAHKCSSPLLSVICGNWNRCTWLLSLTINTLLAAKVLRWGPCLCWLPPNALRVPYDAALPWNRCPTRWMCNQLLLRWFLRWSEMFIHFLFPDYQELREHCLYNLVVSVYDHQWSWFKSQGTCIKILKNECRSIVWNATIKEAATLLTWLIKVVKLWFWCLITAFTCYSLSLSSCNCHFILSPLFSLEFWAKVS